MAQTNEKKLPFGRKLAFAVGDVFGGGSFNIINFLYPGFLAMVVGIPAELAGVVMMIARIWDAVTDPLMGRISDATRSKLGKRRVYILVCVPLVVLSLFLMFYPFSFDALWLRFSAVLMSYILFSTVQTMVMIPYMSLSSEMTGDYQERANVNSLRLGFSIFSSILCVAVPGMIVSAFKNDADPLGKQGYIAMSLLFGGLFAICILVTALFAKETIQTPPRKEKFRLSDFIRPLKLPAFRQYMGMQMCLSFTMAVMSGLFFLYIDFYLRADLYAANNGDSGMLGLIGAALMFAMQIVALPFYLWMIKKTSKAFVYRLGAVLWILTALIMLAVTPSSPDWVVYLMAALMGFGISGCGLVPHTMFGDVNDAGEVAFGERTEGAFGGLMNFINKVAQAVGIALVFAALGLTGFVEQVEGAPLVLSQPPAAQLALKLTLCLSPLVCMGIGILISTRYKIDKAKQAELAETLRLRKEEKT